jgi:acyl-CoA synthetase (AMP-forming)/AMP-acid ligase II
MLGQMMQQPLLISSLLVHAERHHGEQRDRLAAGRGRHPPHHLPRAGRALAPHGQGAGGAGRAGWATASATLAWNGYRHMELYYGVSGSGAVLHTLNPRLHPDQVVYIADHAEDQVLFFDMTFLPLIQAIAGRTKTIRHFVAMTDRAHLPADGEDAQPAVLRGPAWPRRTTATSGRASTRTPPARCATPRAPPATPRACCTATAPPCCTRWPRRCPTAWAARPPTACCRWCRCSTSTPGASSTRRR